MVESRVRVHDFLDNSLEAATMLPMTTTTTYKAPANINCYADEHNVEGMEKFYTRSGWLSDYALACGYIERLDLKYEDGMSTMWLSLWLDGCYHVRAHNFATGERMFWDSFDTLAEARARFIEAHTAIMEGAAA